MLSLWFIIQCMFIGLLVVLIGLLMMSAGQPAGDPPRSALGAGSRRGQGQAAGQTRGWVAGGPRGGGTA